MQRYPLALLGLLMASSCMSRHPPGVVDESYIHRYGVEVPSDEWKVRGESGTVITKMKNGEVISKNYDLGVLHGETTYTYPHSTTIQKKENYEDGRLISEVHYDLLGLPEKEIVYNPDSSTKVTTWYQQGSPKDEEVYFDDKLYSGVYYNRKGQVVSQVEEGSGTRQIVTRKGELTSKEIYEEGNMVLRTKFYPSGTPEEVASFADGKMHGFRKTFFAEGEPVSVEEWENGRQHGTTIIFQAGEKLAEIPYAKGSKHGTEKRYRDGHILVQEVTWMNGVMQGPSVTYFGDAVTTEWYFQDRHVTKPSYDLLTRPALR